MKLKKGEKCPNKMHVLVNDEDLGITIVGSVFCEKCQFNIKKNIDNIFILCDYDKSETKNQPIKIRTFP